MKSKGDLSEIQKQQLHDDSYFFEGNPGNIIHKKKLSENFVKFQKESKYSFVVDWQIPESF